MSYKVGPITVTVAGESHSKALTVILEGIGAGQEIDMEELLSFMQRRAPGKNNQSTPRAEADIPVILSGIKNGFTTGSPISCIIENKDVKSSHYGEILDTPRPGHADYPASVKFGDYFNHCGGGQFSGRLTAALCFAGGIAKQILKRNQIDIYAHISSVGGIKDNSYKEEIIDVSGKQFPVISDIASKNMIELINKARENLNSVGGSIECAVTGVKAGFGDALYNGIDGELAKAVFAVPGVKGIEFGAGFDVCSMYGDENNDEYIIKDDEIKTLTNNHGGVLGGMTSGMPILFNVAMKPTPSIAKAQKSVDLKNKTNKTLEIKGRHDPCIVHRAVPVIEAVTAIVILGKISEGR